MALIAASGWRRIQANELVGELCRCALSAGRGMGRKPTDNELPKTLISDSRSFESLAVSKAQPFGTGFGLTCHRGTSTTRGVTRQLDSGRVHVPC